MPTVPYIESLYKRLRADHKYALTYLNACSDDPATLELALKDIAEAFKKPRPWVSVLCVWVGAFALGRLVVNGVFTILSALWP